MSARKELLARISAAIGERPADREADYAAIPREYIRGGALTQEQRIEIFIDRLIDYDSLVHRTSASGIAGIIAAAGKRRLIVPDGFPDEWLPDGLDFQRDRNLDYAAIDHADGVLTACTIAIAQTGTIVLQNVPGQGRRAISLIPDYLLCVVHELQVVETVSEAMTFLNAHSALATTFISGPSATSDIEMTRVKGVHGPRTLEIVLVGDEHA